MKFRSDIKVELIQHYGTDEMVAKAARVSTGADQIEGKSIEGLIKYLLRFGHCYDDQTEILTRDRGWVLFQDLTEHDLVLARTVSGKIQWEKPTDYIHEPYDGDMIRLTGKNLDLLVTPNHRMLAQKRVNGGWSETAVFPASDFELRSHKVLRGGGNRKGVEYDPIKAKLLGFIIADAHVERGRIAFHLRKDRKIAYLRDVLGESLMENTQKDDYRIPMNWDSDLTRLAKLTYNDNKDRCIPKEVLDTWSGESIRHLLDGLLFGDGHTDCKGTTSLATVSPMLAEQVQVAAVLSGSAASINGPFDYGKRSVETGWSKTYKPIYNVILANKRNLSVRVGWTDTERKRNVQRERYDGNIYCVTVPSGIVYVRRNGKTAWSGNSSPVEHCGATFRIEAPMFVRDQWVRHRTMSYNCKSLRFSEAEPEFYVPPINRPLHNAGNGAHPDLVPLDDMAAAYSRKELEESYTYCWDSYYSLVGMGVAEEIARAVLPSGLYTSFYATANLWNWIKFLEKRRPSESNKPQWEIVDAADQITLYLKELFPVVMSCI